jgi:plastocyanin
MNETLFYVFGIALVVSAVGIAAVGLRFESFPPTRGVLAGAIVYFAALVGLTAFFAVRNAQDEQRHREAEQAAETESTTTTPAGGPVQLAADPSSIAYTTTSLEAQAGNVTIDFDNPNPAIPHDVCVQAGGGQPQCSKQVTDGKTTLDLKDLKPGSYTFYCSVDDHEAAGMKGTLTAQ